MESGFRVCLLPSCTFPSVRWWLLTLEKQVVVPLNEHYIKQSYRNRYDIADAHGVRTLTVPVVGQKGAKLPFNEIHLADGKWKREHLGALRAAYGKAPWFEHYFPEMEALYQQPHTKLVDFNTATQRLLAKWLKWTLSPSQEMQSADWEMSDIKMLSAFEPGTRATHFKPYVHVFMDRQPFQSDLSVLDVVMNLGPRASDYLFMLKKDQQLLPQMPKA